MGRLLIYLVYLFSFGLVTIGTSDVVLSDTKDFYQMTFESYLNNEKNILPAEMTETFNEWLALYDIEIISLTNLLDNGQLVNGVVGWTWAGSASFLNVNGEGVLLVTVSNTSGRLPKALSSGVSYYWRGSIKSSSNLCKIGLFTPGSSYYSYNASSGASNWETFSNIYTPSSNLISAVLGIFDTRVSGFDNVYVDDIMLFESGSYSKTQIDAVIDEHGYIEYNVLHTLPDYSNDDYDDVLRLWGDLGYDQESIDFQNAYTEFFGSYSSFVIADLDELSYVQSNVTYLTLAINDLIALFGSCIVWFLLYKLIRRMVRK